MLTSKIVHLNETSSDIVLLKLGNLNQNAKRYKARNTEREFHICRSAKRDDHIYWSAKRDDH